MNNELQHFGVKGMHWGVRRYQNEDGSYNSAGQKRYARNANGDYTGVNGKGKNKSSGSSKKGSGNGVSTARKVAGTAMMVGGAAMMIGTHRANAKTARQLAQIRNQMASNAKAAKRAGFGVPRPGGQLQYHPVSTASVLKGDAKRIGSAAKSVGGAAAKGVKRATSKIPSTSRSRMREASARQKMFAELGGVKAPKLPGHDNPYIKATLSGKGKTAGRATSMRAKNISKPSITVGTPRINTRSMARSNKSLAKEIKAKQKSGYADVYKNGMMVGGKPAGSAINRPSTSSAVKKTTSDYVMVNGKRVKKKTKSTSTRVSKSTSQFQKSKTTARKYGAKPLNSMKDIERYFT